MILAKDESHHSLHKSNPSISFTKVLSHHRYPISRKEDSSPDRRKNKTQVVIISSMGRSGSTFLSELLKTIPGSVLFFEPLQMIQSDSCVSDIRCHSSYLKKILSCQSDNSYLAWFKKKMLFFKYLSKESQDCSAKDKAKVKDCFLHIDVNKVCSESPVVMTKLIRSGLKYLVSLLEDDSLNVKIIYLVRDPRGSIASINKFRGWEKSPRTLCSNLYNDLMIYEDLHLSYPHRVIKVFYEDLAYDTNTVMSSILRQFFGLTTLPSLTREYIHNHTRYTPTKRNSMGTYKNSKNQYQAWRQTISTSLLNQIETEPYCRAIIRNMGLRFFHSRKYSKKLNLSLFDDFT